MGGMNAAPTPTLHGTGTRLARLPAPAASRSFRQGPAESAGSAETSKSAEIWGSEAASKNHAQTCRNLPKPIFATDVVVGDALRQHGPAKTPKIPINRKTSVKQAFSRGWEDFQKIPIIPENRPSLAATSTGGLLEDYRKGRKGRKPPFARRGSTCASREHTVRTGAWRVMTSRTRGQA